MTPTVRTLALWVTATAVAVFGAASVAAYRPGGVTDRALAFESLKRALASLNDEALDSTARLAAYRDGLKGTDAALLHTLRSNPTDTTSIERLATVRWESGVLAGDPDADSVLSLVSIAAARAPRVPEIQADLGSLLYKMGSPAEAAPFMRRAVELSPAITNRVVATMQDAGIEPAEIFKTMPRTVELIVVLREGLARSGHLEEWLLSAEELLPKHPRELLWSYTTACLAANAEDRLLAQTERLGVLTENNAETDHQIAIGRAQLARKAWSLAASAAARARALSPADSGVLDYAGQMALAAGDSVQAEAAFRDALGALAFDGSLGIDRARLYRQHGEALERLGRVDEAFDEYRRAIEILPDDPWLRQRFAAWSPKPLSEGLP